MTAPNFTRYHFVSRLAGGLAVTGGLLALAGWLLDIPRLTDFTYDGIRMKANTAFAVALSGVSLLLLLPENPGRARRMTGLSLALLVSLIGLATLSEHVVGWDLGIDQLIVNEPPGEAATVSPGRMGPPGSTSFTLIGLGLLLINERRKWLIVAQSAVLTVATVTLLNLVGNLYDARELFALVYTGISRQTALILIVVAVGILSARPDRGIMSVLSSDLAGGVILRRLLLPAAVVPVLLGWICLYGVDARWFDVRFGVSLFSVSLIITLVTVLLWNSRALNNLSLRRLAAERERERLLDSERHARQEVERTARLKDEFLATLSHELRTPLTAIQGWVYLIRQTPEHKEHLHKGLDVIERNVAIQSQLIADLLDMSRIVSGKMRLNIQRLDLSSVIHAAIDSVRPAVEQREIRLQIDLNVINGRVMGDSARLQQVVWNIVSNAVKFTPRGGEVAIKMRESETHVNIIVTDSGQGIQAEFLPHVFERFRQADASMARRHGGLGIGLAIVKQLVELHGGNVSVSSDGIGRGVTFNIVLPLAVPVDNHAARPRAANAGGRSARQKLAEVPRLEGVSILVLDDEGDSREIIVRVLSDFGANVIGATTPVEASELLKKQAFEVFVSDIGMPLTNGYELLRTLRSQGIDIPAIAVTAYARAEDRTHALQAGFQAHIAKPFDPAELLAAVALLLQPQA
jgi:signal transduction histidine kinase/CheY-like chemotaxis protein